MSCGDLRKHRDEQKFVPWRVQPWWRETLEHAFPAPALLFLSSQVSVSTSLHSVSCRRRDGGGRAHVLAFRVISLLPGSKQNQAAAYPWGPLPAAGFFRKGEDEQWCRGWWAGGRRVSLTALFPRPLPHLPRPWCVTCQAPQPLAFPSKCLPSCFLDRLLKTRTLNGTQMGAAKSSSPLVFLGPSQKCSSR